MGVPTDRKYLSSHEWHRVEGGECVVGITQFAADELTDITYVNLPAVGKSLVAGKPFGEVESVKATSDLICGVSGEVVAVNKQLNDSPELVNKDPFDKGWMVRVKLSNPGELEKLMNAAGYDQQIGT